MEVRVPPGARLEPAVDRLEALEGTVGVSVSGLRGPVEGEW